MGSDLGNFATKCMKPIQGWFLVFGYLCRYIGTVFVIDQLPDIDSDLSESTEKRLGHELRVNLRRSFLEND